ncbi:uncharacterized protein LOC129805644 isoform X2 [Phlebotomus papatasi]|nr:uncharacterized protein LOC129805644 isoform X2 [Phlebotomus papatasi]
MNVDGSTVNVRQRMQILENSPRTIEKRGYARYIDPTGRLVMIYNETDPTASIFDYYITHTDYHGYLIATSCENVNNTHYAESAWVMSRGRTLPPSALTVVNQATQHWNPAYFRHTNQDTRVCSSSHKMALASIILLMALLTILFLR